MIDRLRRGWIYLVAIFTLPTAPLVTYVQNQSGLRALSRGEKLPAYRAFVGALEADPLNPLVQINLALAFELNEEFDKAALTYESLGGPAGAEELILGPGSLAPGHPLRASVAFNLGVVRGKARQIPAALRAYQTALDEGASSLKVKTNIELLFKGGGQGEGDSSGDPSDSKDQKDPSKKDAKDDKKDQKDDRNNQKKREDSLKQPPESKPEKGKDKPKPFQSQDLTPEDVKRILDEIKNQEQGIRAQEYDKQPKDGARGGKDW